MGEFFLYNTLTKQVEQFTPTQPGKVRIYNCGPTVYKRQHIGNMRRFLVADFLRRTLELFGYEVRDITNITDVGHLTQDEIDAGEDKLEKEAREQKQTPQAIAHQQIKLFMSDLQQLNIKPSSLYPRASAHIAAMQRLITELLAAGLAYQTPSGVYFNVTAFPDYGKLSGNTLANLAAGARVEVRGEKQHPADFALWIVDPKHLQQWDSPWGVGYPGWHIECSAMASEYLGSNIDIHTGGEDNIFPHHENEIAQSEGATGQSFVRFWLHNRHLQVAGKKLAKREGEQITVDTIAAKGFSPLAFRLLVFASHYRSKIDFSWEALAQAQENIISITNLLRRLEDAQAGGQDTATMQEFTAALADDLNTPQALAVFLNYLTGANSLLDTDDSQKNKGNILATLLAMDTVLGVAEPLQTELAHHTVPEAVRVLAQQREQARSDKNFELADQVRTQIEAAGYTVEDTPSGPRLVSR